MKKILMIAILLGFVASPLFAAAITDATKPLGSLKPSLTVEDNYIFKRTIDKGASQNTFDTEKINQVYGKLALGLIEGLNIYTKLGASNTGTIKDYNDSGENRRIETDYGFLWGVGTSYVKEISNGWSLGVDAQFDYWKSDANKIKYNDTAASSVSGSIINYEIQGTPFIAKKIDIPSFKWSLDPYLGVKFSYFKTETDKQLTYSTGAVNRTDSWSLRGKDYVGIVVGSDLQINKHIALQVEGRFIDETAITAGGTYKF